MTGATGRPALVSVDWGTSSLRAYLLSESGAVIDTRESAQGIMAVAGGAFADALHAACAAWLADHGTLPAILSGMIGSRQGWVEAPYVGCPASIEALGDGLVALDVGGFGAVRLVPGVAARDAAGLPDVMRGEECQIFGALALMDMDGGRFLLPGTHSKLVEVAGGGIVAFRTFMTGEVFAALRGHTILGRMLGETGGDGAGFVRGVAAGAASPTPGALLGLLFSVRTLRLFDEIGAPDALDYLSGMLIGAELAVLRGAPEPVVLVGGAELQDRYRTAAGLLGIPTIVAPPAAVRAGHLAIARRAGLVGQP